MKQLKVCIAFVALMLFGANIALANDQPLTKEPIAICSIIGVEGKEAYKVDDAEYTVGVMAKTNFYSSRIGYEGIKLIAGLALIGSLFTQRTAIAATLMLVGSICWYFEPTSLAILAVAPALKIDTSGLEKDSPEYQVITELGKRLKLEGIDEPISKKDLTDALKAYDEEVKKVKNVNFEKLAELLDEKKGALAILLKQGAKITELEHKGQKNKSKDWRKMIKDEFANEEKLKRWAQTQETKGMMNFFNGEKWEEGTGLEATKAGTITTGVVTTDSGGNALLDLMSVEDLRAINLQEPFIERFSSVSRTSRPVYPYADYEPNSGDAAFTAENSPKSQMDLKVVVKTVTPKKVTGYSTLSTESVEDIPRMQSEATNFILRKVLLKRQNKILFGTGAGSDPIGVAGKARTYNQAGLLDHQGNPIAGSLLSPANGNGVQAPNLFDAIQAAALQIYQTANYIDEMEYFPNLVILNPADLASLKLKKSTFNSYLFPEILFNNGDNPVRIGNINVIGKAQMAPGYMMIGDFTRLEIINYIDYTLRVGWINDNLINNLFTMVGENRFYTVIRELDRNAFIYDQIENITGPIAA